MTTTPIPVANSATTESINVHDSETSNLSISCPFANNAAQATNSYILSHHARSSYSENFVLIWMNASVDESDDDTRNVITDLLCIVNSIEIFTDPNECVDFITNVRDKNVFVIVSDNFVQQLVPLLQTLTQLDSIYVLGGHNWQHEQWVKECKKVKGIFTKIEPLGHALRQNIRHSSSSLIPISIIPPYPASDLG